MTQQELELKLKQLEDYCRQLQNRSVLTEQEGEIIYIYPPETVTEKFSKIYAGIDASYETPRGGIEPCYLGFEISSYDKSLFDQFKEGKFKVGDRIRIRCTVGSRGTWNNTKKGGRIEIISNVTLCYVKFLSEAKENSKAQTAPSAPVAAHEEETEPPF